MVESNIKARLKNPFDRISKGNRDEFQKECAAIAQELFSHCCIKCNNDTEYYFAEIEFYYYEKGKWEEKWNQVTYPRNGYDAGQLFYHLSGIDICFDSYYNNDCAKFGGILIRAIKDIRGIITAGPLSCKDVILNACKDGEMPQLAGMSNTQELKIKSIYRALGKDDIDKEYDRLCFYDNCIEEWSLSKERYNTRIGKIESKKGTYKTDRFNAHQ